MGSKSRIAKHIVPILQKYIDNNDIRVYVEPFVGGANVIDKIKCERKIGYNINKYLIALLKHVQQGLPLYESVNRELYNQAKTDFKTGRTEFQDWQLGNIGFLVSYNGKWFDGGYAKPGYEKTKYGHRYRDYYRESKDNLLKQADMLADIDFITGDYKIVSSQPYNNMLIYCDPPYQNTTEFANSKCFDYIEFWNTMRDWSENNFVIISELQAPNDFKCIWEQEVSRSLNAKGKGTATEKLFIYNPAQ